MHFPDIQADLGQFAGLHGKSLIVRNQSWTTDTYGRRKSVSTTDTSTDGIILPIHSMKPEQVPAGFVADENSYMAYIKGNMTINPKDLIIDGNIEYVINKIEKYGIPSQDERIYILELMRK